MFVALDDTYLRKKTKRLSGLLKKTFKKLNKLHLPYFEIAALALLVASTLVVLKYTFSKDFFFYSDDWAWLNITKFLSAGQIFSILPTQIYNDRPFGAVFILVLQKFFALNQLKYHVVFVGLHIFNALILYLIGKRLFNNKITPAFVSAFSFAINYSVLHSMLTVGTIFDLLGGTCILLTYWLHLQEKKSLKILSYIFLYLSLRTKEVAIMLPSVLILSDFLLSKNPFILRIINSLKQNIIPLVMFVIFTVRYAYLSTQLYIPDSDPYKMQVNLASLVEAIRFHLSTTLYLDELMGYRLVWMIIIACIFLSLKNRRFFLSIGSALLLMLPTAFLPSHFNTLYFYIPSVFLFLAFGACVDMAIKMSMKSSEKEVLLAKLFVLLFCARMTVSVIHSPYYANRVNFSLMYGKEFRTIFEKFTQANAFIPSDTYIALQDFPGYFNVFDYGPCNALKVHYGKKDIVCGIYKSAEDLHKEGEQFKNVIYVVYKNGAIEILPQKQ